MATGPVELEEVQYVGRQKDASEAKDTQNSGKASIGVGCRDMGNNATRKETGSE